MNKNAIWVLANIQPRLRINDSRVYDFVKQGRVHELKLAGNEQKF